MNQWVQHKSGVGEKWEVVRLEREVWQVNDPRSPAPGSAYFLWLPQSEYVVVPGPEAWINISSECVTCSPYSNPHGSVLEDRVHVIARIDRGYRLRKVQGKCMNATDWAFIVERLEPAC